MTSIKNAPAAPSGFFRQKRRIVVPSPAPAVTVGAAVMTSRPESATAGFVATLHPPGATARLQHVTSEHLGRPSKTAQIRAPVRSEPHARPGKTGQMRAPV